MDRDSILSRLTALDFMAVDIALYLDTHPKDEEAISVYNKVIKEASFVRMQYEKNFGPLCSFRSLSNDEKFTWIDKPWPWECNANFYINGEDC